jgi:hypothetical protein
MNSAALLVVLASSKAAGIAGGSYATVSVVLAGAVVSVEVAVDVLAAASSTLFLSFIPSVQILLRATDEVLSAAFDHSDELVARGLRPLPFLVYSGAMSVAYQFATFDDDNLSFLLPGGAGSYVAFLIVSYAVLLKFGADSYAVAVAAAPKLVRAAARVPGLVASAVRSFRAILAGKSHRYVTLLDFLLRTVPLFAVNQVMLGASTVLRRLVGRNNNKMKNNKKRVTFHETAQVREYSVTLGDHPWAQGGCPLGLDWEHAEAKECSLEEMEQRKVGVMGRRLSPAARFDRIVQVSGIDPNELMREERWRQWAQMEDQRLTDAVPDEDDMAAPVPAAAAAAVVVGTNPNGYVNILEFLLFFVPRFLVSKVLRGAKMLLGFGLAAPEPPAAAAAATEVAEGGTSKKRVTFNETAQVREYSVTLGDHPEAGKKGGCPLSLDWEYAEAKEVSLEAMEQRKVGVLGRYVKPVDRFNRIVQVSGIDPDELVQEELRRRMQQAEDDRLAFAKKRVTFNETAQVREYSVTLGDNPCAGKNGGCPLSLDWEYAEAKEVRLEAMEQRKVGVLGRYVKPVDRFNRIVQVSGIDPDELVQEELRRRMQQAEDDRRAAEVPDKEGDPEVGAEIVLAPVELCEPEHGPFLGGDDDYDDDDYMDVDMDEAEGFLEKEPMVAKVSVSADLVCKQEHGPFRGVDNEDDDDDDEEVPVPPQEDDESELAVEAAIHNPDPAMKELVEALSRLSLDGVDGGDRGNIEAKSKAEVRNDDDDSSQQLIGDNDEHRLAKLAEEKQAKDDKDDKKVQSDDKVEATPREGEEKGKVVESDDETEKEDDLQVEEEEEEDYYEDVVEVEVEQDPVPAESFPVSVTFGEDGEPEDDDGKESKPTREHRIANLVAKKHDESEDAEASEESGNTENGVEFDGRNDDDDEEAESSGGAEVEGGDVKAESTPTIRNADEGSAPMLDDDNDDWAPLPDHGDDDVAQPLDDNESALALALSAIPNPEPAMRELAVEAVPPPLSRRRPRRHVTFGNVQVQQYNLTLGDHPCADETGGYAISLDWAHAEVEEYSLDWYEETKPNCLILLTAEERKFVIEDISGTDRPALEALEAQRLEAIEQERLEQQKQRQARSKARKAARALPPVRRSARLANQAPPAETPSPSPLRRSARLANKPRCSYKD